MLPGMIDIFNNNAFGVVELTDAINELTFVPGRIGEMGIFGETGVTTTAVSIEQKGDILVLVNPSPRGGPGQTVAKEGRTLRSISVPHFEINDAIMAEEVQGVRAFGTENQLETLMGRITERGASHSQSMAATQELARIGAIKGVVTYADGSTLNLFTEFGVSQETEVDLDLDNATPASGVLRQKCAAIVRLIANNLGAVPFSGVHAFAGDTLFDQLLAHSEVRATYLGWTAAQILREGYISPNGKVYSAFEFGGIVWENYRGAVGGTAFIDPLKAHIFPTGVPGLFKTAYAPADYEETVNTIGQRLYAKQYPMPNGKGRNFDMQMNNLEYCTRPKVLIKARNT